MSHIVVIGRNATGCFNKDRALIAQKITQREARELVRDAEVSIGAFSPLPFKEAKDPIEAALKKRRIRTQQKANTNAKCDFTSEFVAIDVLIDPRNRGHILGFEKYTLKEQPQHILGGWKPPLTWTELKRRANAN